MSAPTAVMPDANTFVVTGGAGYAVRLDSLEASAQILSDVALAIARAQQSLYLVRQRVAAAACPGSELAVHVDDECRRLESVARRCLDETGREVVSVRLAAAAYEEEEAKRRSAIDGLQNLLVGSDRLVGLLRVLGFRMPVGPDTSSSYEMGAWMSALLRSAARKELEGGPDDPVLVQRSSVAAGVGDGSTFAYAVKSLSQAQGKEALDDGTVVPPSSILLERFPQQDGSATFMVTVPGTESWHLDEARGNIFDSESILHGLTSKDSHVRTLIRQALEEQNVGDHDRVVFTSYSQGTIHVMGLLEDQEFTDRYHVAAVTSVGGPVSAFSARSNIPVLSLSNADDVVPAASGRTAAPSASIVDVRTPSRIGVQGTALFPAETVAQAHSLENYAGDAMALDESSDPAVRGFAGALGTALGDSVAGAQRERFVYTGLDSRLKAGTAK